MSDDEDNDFDGGKSQSCAAISMSDAQSSVQQSQPDESEARKQTWDELKKKFTSKGLSDEVKNQIDCLLKHCFHVVSPSGHNGKIPTKKAKEFLIDGPVQDPNDKKKVISGNKHMPKTKRPDDWQDFLDWQYLDIENENQEITYGQCQLLVEHFWELKYIKKSGDAFKGAYAKKPQTFYVITLGSGHDMSDPVAAPVVPAKDEEDGEVVEDMTEEEKAAAKAFKDEQAKKALAKSLVKKVYNRKDYDNALEYKDCENKILNLKNELRWKLCSTIQSTGIKVKKGLWRYEDLTDFITEALDNVFQIDPKPTRTYFYYSGEADENGNMRCEDGSTVSVTWILDKALELELEHHFELHFDSDYSGKLCEQAREWWKKFDEERNAEMKDDNFDRENILRSIQMECNTDSTHKCVKGAHQNMILKYKDNSVTKGVSEKERAQYVEDYGKTYFSSTRAYDTQIIETKAKPKANV